MATAPVPTAHLAARAPESPLAACPRAFPQSGRTALAFPSRPASRCSAPGSPLGRWRWPSPRRPPRSPPPRPAEGKGLPQEPPPSSQFELRAGAGSGRAGSHWRKERASGRKQSPAAAAFRLELGGGVDGGGGGGDGGGGRGVGGLSLPPLGPGL